MSIIVKIYHPVGFIGKKKGSSVYSIVKSKEEAFDFTDTNTAMTAISLLGLVSSNIAFEMRI